MSIMKRASRFGFGIVTAVAMVTLSACAADSGEEESGITEDAIITPRTCDPKPSHGDWCHAARLDRRASLGCLGGSGLGWHIVNLSSCQPFAGLTCRDGVLHHVTKSEHDAHPELDALPACSY